MNGKVPIFDIFHLMQIASFAKDYVSWLFFFGIYRQGIFNNNRAKCLTLVFGFDLGNFSLAEYYKPWIHFCNTI